MEIVHLFLQEREQTEYIRKQIVTKLNIMETLYQKIAEQLIIEV